MAKARDRVELRQGRWRYFLNHQEVTRREYEAVYPPPDVGRAGDVPAGSTTWRKPVTSLTQGVHPDQIAEAQAEDRKRGVPVEYAADGSPIFRDRAIRRAYLKAYGMIDRDSFTGY